MAKSEERLFEALDYDKPNKHKLTEKQYLVYSYLMSISWWNAQRKKNHYYVYKNSFVIKDICKILGITPPTWRNSIAALKKYHYISDTKVVWAEGSTEPTYETLPYYLIEIPNSFAPLNIHLIRFLINCQKSLKSSGNIVSVYSVLYKYWNYCKKNNKTCEITINQLKNLFAVKKGVEFTERFRLMLGIFSQYNLISMKPEQRKYHGMDYIAYVITDVRLDLSPEAEMVLNDMGGPNNIEEVVTALKE